MDESIRQRNRKAVDLYNKIMAKKKIIGGDTFPLSPENTKALGRAVEDDVARALIGGDKFPLSPENTKALGRAVEDDVIAAATGAGKSSTMREMLAKMTPEARAEVIARPDVMRNIEGSIAKAAPMETPYGKSFLSYTPEGKIAGKAGSMLRGLGRVAGPLGAALTALDLAQGLGEVQDKGAAKIAEDYKKSKMAESEAEILTPEADEFREGLKSKRTELEILRAELDRKRQREERENRGINRQALARDTLEKIGLAK
jgi:hypothetical protein